MSTIAVPGGSGGLGRALVEAFKNEGYKTIILSRKSNPNLEEEAGVPVLAADYTNVDSLVKLLEENNVGTVVSVLNDGMDMSAEHNMVQAAEKSKVTKRFIPNLWSAMIYRPEHASVFPMAKPRLDMQDALAASTLEYTLIYVGLFMEYVVPNLPTHIERYVMAIDLDHHKAGIPGTGNVPISFTYSKDIGKYAAQLLSLPKWEKEYVVAGDIATWNEVLAMVEKSMGTKFDVSYDSVEMLEKGQITELPGYAKALKLFNADESMKPMVFATMARFGLWMQQGKMVYEGFPDLKVLFPEVKPLTLQEAFKQAA